MADVEMVNFGLEAGPYEVELIYAPADPLNATVMIVHSNGTSLSMTFTEFMEMAGIIIPHIAEVMKK